MKKQVRQQFKLFYPRNALSFKTLENRFEDMIAVTTKVIKSDMLKHDEEKAAYDLYLDNMYSCL